MNTALRAISKITGVKITQAARSIRNNALFGDEIHIDEELINLEEAIETYHLAKESVRAYPRLYRQIAREKHEILTHCMGLVARMLRRQRLPHRYNQKDTIMALRTLVNLVVRDLEKNYGYDDLEESVKQKLLPYMNARHYLRYREKNLHPMGYIAAIMPHRLRTHFV